MSFGKRISSLLMDWREQLSWGRFCAAVALWMAVRLSFVHNPNIALIAMWLGVATGSYGLSKWTEMICSSKQVAEPTEEQS